MTLHILCTSAGQGKNFFDQFLSNHFQKTFTYLEKQEWFYVYHQETIRLSTVKRYLKKFNLFSRPIERIRTDDATLLAAKRRIT